MTVIVSGLRTEPLDGAVTTAELRNDAYGAVVSFEGTVRTPNDGRDVEYLEYEAYEPVAEGQLATIATEVGDKYDLGTVVCLHRTGQVFPSEPAVLVVAIAAHRNAAFDGCRELIDRIKAEVAIWKKEVCSQGSYWVGASGEANSTE